MFFSGLKYFACLKEHNLGGSAKIMSHSQLYIIAMLPVAQAAVNTHKTGKFREHKILQNNFGSNMCAFLGNTVRLNIWGMY